MMRFTPHRQVSESKGKVRAMVYTGMAENGQRNEIPNLGATGSNPVGRTIFQSLSGSAFARFTTFRKLSRPFTTHRPAR